MLRYTLAGVVSEQHQALIVRTDREAVMSTRPTAEPRKKGAPGPSPRPRWDCRNLRRHYDAHPGGKDRECWKDLLGKRTTVSIEEYEVTSYEVFHKAWLEYEARYRDEDIQYGKVCSYRKPRAYYVDGREIVLITTLTREEIVTCFHKHYESRCTGA